MTTSARTRRVAATAAWVAAGALGATAVTGLAFAADHGSGAGAGIAARTAAVSAGSPSSPGALGAAGTGRRAGILKNVLHGRFTMTAGDGTKVVDVQRGRLTTASASSITVASSDGFSATYGIGSATTVRKAGQTVPTSSLAVGDEVVVRASDGTASVIRTR